MARTHQFRAAAPDWTFSAFGLSRYRPLHKTVLGALLPAPSLSKIGMLFAFIDELSSSRRILPNCRITPSHVMSYELIPARFPSSPVSSPSAKAGVWFCNAQSGKGHST
ncbi:hypothetical protein [Burkholderia vietnamiensis]|uniref:hypothetical protein n=1 Tax=Burkholderia vietnamiensis TaxID=60552 RepID=UPI0026352D9B|nr:hypothetical protein [Burkholderia vietnamiensis]MDN8071438.1 hypothetical protein [Burkholderia vietnamiensis]